MTRLDYRTRNQFAFLVILSAFAAIPSHAQTPSPQPCELVEGHSQPKFSNLAETLRNNPYSFFARLVKWKGEPSKCRGGLNEERTDGDDWWLDFFWPDGSKLEATIMPPEISIIEFTRAEGLVRPDEVVRLTRQYAEEAGMKIDWTASKQTQEGRFLAIEHTAPTGGPNVFIRFTYDEQQRLVGVWVSIAD